MKNSDANSKEKNESNSKAKSKKNVIRRLFVRRALIREQEERDFFSGYSQINL